MLRRAPARSAAGVSFHCSVPWIAASCSPTSSSSRCNLSRTLPIARLPSFSSVTLPSGCASTAALLCAFSSAFPAFSFSRSSSALFCRASSRSIASMS